MVLELIQYLYSQLIINLQIFFWLLNHSKIARLYDAQIRRWHVRNDTEPHRIATGFANMSNKEGKFEDYAP